MSDTRKRVRACFYRNEGGQEPVRDWLKELSKKDKKAIGTDIMTVEYGWPVGMPVCRALGDGLFEIRTRLEARIDRVLFSFSDGQIILLHGFITKTQKTPQGDLQLARTRQKEVGK